MPETTISRTESVGAETIAVELAAPRGFDGEPGQFVQVSAPLDDEQSSYYTLSSPEVNGTFEITVAVDDDSSVGSWLAKQATGDTVQVDGPYGEIAYTGGKDVLVLAGGPGIGPGVAIGERALPDQDVTVVYKDNSYVHRDRLDALAADGVTVEYLQPEEQIAPGLLRPYLDRSVFVFGFNSFVDDASEAIEKAGGDVGIANIESFGPE